MQTKASAMRTKGTHVLNPHPLSAKLYGKVDTMDKATADLRDSIKQHGILVPIICTPDGTIISGHTRWEIAKLLQIYDVPVQEVDIKDDLKIRSLIIHSNRQREKTPEQRAREYRELKRIEAAKAKARKEAQLKRGTEKPDKENLPEREEVGQSRDKAAAAVGWSGKTAEKAADVVDRIDELEEQGDTEGAEQLRETLNEGSVSKAHAAVKPEKAKPKAKPKPEPAPPPNRNQPEGINHTQLERLKLLFEQSNQETQDAFLDLAAGFTEEANP